MLNQPVFRYNSQNPDLLDGAMFAFVEGTDPEACLLHECGGCGLTVPIQPGCAQPRKRQRPESAYCL
jgi:hypothetical protein